MDRRALGSCLLAAACFGASTPAAARLAGDGMSPFTLAGLLYLGAAVAVLPVAVRSRPRRASVRRARGRLAVAVVVGGAVGPVLLAAGLARLSPATSSLLLNLELAFTVVLAAALFGEHLGRRVVAGTALVLAGGVVLGWSGQADLRWGAVLVAGACLCWALDNGVTAALDELAPAHVTLAKGVVAGGANLVIGLVLGGRPGGGAVLAAVAVGAVGYGASITLWVAGARRIGAARGQLAFAVAPFLGTAVAWAGFGAPVLAREVVALALAGGGVLLVLDSGHEHPHDHAAVDHDHEHDHDDGHHDHDHGSPVRGRHRHHHRHRALVHAHPHVPDLHHRHGHP